MFNRTRIAGVVTAVCCAAALCLPAQAAEVDCDSVYCFTGADFQEEVVGICVTDLPDPAAGTVLLGTRVVRAGDILTAEQLSKLTFSPLWTEEDRDAVVTYLPIFEKAKTDEKIIAIPFGDPTYNSYKDISELPKHIFDEMAHFYTVYKQLENKTTAVDEIIGADEVHEIIQGTIDKYKDEFC